MAVLGCSSVMSLEHLSLLYALLGMGTVMQSPGCQRWSPRGHILKSLASSPQKLSCPRLEDNTIFEPLKFRWKTPETLRKICKDLFFGFLM